MLIKRITGAWIGTISVLCVKLTRHPDSRENCVRLCLNVGTVENTHDNAVVSRWSLTLCLSLFLNVTVLAWSTHVRIRPSMAEIQLVKVFCRYAWNSSCQGIFLCCSNKIQYCAVWPAVEMMQQLFAGDLDTSLKMAKCCALVFFCFCLFVFFSFNWIKGVVPQEWLFENKTTV